MINLTKNWRKIASTTLQEKNFFIAIDASNYFWGWGNNEWGQLGVGNRINYLKPVCIGSVNDWSDVAVGNSGYTISLKLNGTIWSWGNNEWGQLGLGDYTNRYEPWQITTDSDWTKIATDYDGNSFAQKRDGTIWGWGKSLPITVNGRDHNFNTLILLKNATWNEDDTITFQSSEKLENEWILIEEKCPKVADGYLEVKYEDGTIKNAVVTENYWRTTLKIQYPDGLYWNPIAAKVQPLYWRKRSE